MAKIKAASVSFANGNMYIVDKEGNLWVKYKSGEWQLIELPDMPKDGKFSVRVG